MPQYENTIQIDILNWYDINHRTLPWRISPKTNKSSLPDPYTIWLSEIMLQQTTVTTVEPYFKKFMQKWPTIFCLSSATEEEILSAWAGLGYYTRARNLKKCADVIVQKYEGYFPNKEDILKKLPGIGDYTASAIVAIAFNHFAVVIDTNIERIISRCFAITKSLPLYKKTIKSYARTITSASRPGDFVQAMMDLGSLICTAKKPLCHLCPIQKKCLTFSRGESHLLGITCPKKKSARVGAIFLAITSDNRILLRKRTKTRLLKGMDELPGSDWSAKKDGGIDVGNAPFLANWTLCNTITHTFTHFNLKLFIWKTVVPQIISIPESKWCYVQDLTNIALPTVMKKAISAGGIKIPK
ncbi:A/G-specific adenine glycosylase [Candidatus Liberibacter solanacearum]|uniref:Adenine DNA glycosylase n=1 Tax=Candidatus Liberibacter solanacearum TaxID=556287 RepID=A0A1V2N885_9HYPH|nr:A/G-specific adenine glycosylase [Candidatus Liberibacter solanacearum]ONI59133.1 A/G-specific adenine glycosylase [Candidatus Liberibacter solanacearum]ONI59927.1 A/G-specific adenine glycosylase [Candidatus Liberibacter solanacearum]